MKKVNFALILGLMCISFINAEGYLHNREQLKNFAPSEYGISEFLFLKQLSSGGYLACGEFDYNGQNPDPNAISGHHGFVVETDADMNQLYERTFISDSYGTSVVYVDKISDCWLVGVSNTSYGTAAQGELRFVDADGGSTHYDLKNTKGMYLSGVTRVVNNNYLIYGRTPGSSGYGTITDLDIDPNASISQNINIHYRPKKDDEAEDTLIYISSKQWTIDDVISTSTGHVVGIGDAAGSSSYIVKLTSGLSEVWNDQTALYPEVKPITADDGYSNYVSSICEGKDGHYYITGDNNSRLYITEINTDGEVLRSVFAPANDSYGDHIVCTDDGGFIVSGGVELGSFGTSRYYLYMLKYDSNLNLIWSYNSKGKETPELPNAKYIIKNANDNFVIAGFCSDDVTSTLLGTSTIAEYSVEFNDKPVISNISPDNSVTFEMKQYQSQTFSYTATDPEGKDLLFSSQGYYQGAGEGEGGGGGEYFSSQTSSLELTPNVVGNWVVNGSVYETDYGNSVYTSWNVNVIPADVYGSDVAIYHYATHTFNVNESGDSYTYSWKSVGEESVQTSSNESFVFTGQEVGDCNVVCEVIDGVGNVKVYVWNVDVAIQQISKPDEEVGIREVKVFNSDESGKLYTYIWIVTDAKGNTSSPTGVETFNFSKEDTGDYILTCEVTDGTTLHKKYTWNISVANLGRITTDNKFIQFKNGQIFVCNSNDNFSGNMNVKCYDFAPSNITTEELMPFYFEIGGTGFTGTFPLDLTFAYQTPVPTNKINIQLWSSNDGINWVNSQVDDGVNIINVYSDGYYGVEFTTNHFSYWAIGYEEDASLAVTLTDFSAKQNSGSVELSWTTESEINNAGFIIERKINDEQWSEIANYANVEGLVGAGNSSESTEYSYTDAQVLPGCTYKYRIIDCDLSGKKSIYENTVEVDVKESLIQKVENFALNNAYPNPFNPSTTFSYSLKDNSKVKLDIYDASGKLIETLVNEIQGTGNYRVNWNAMNYSSGVYFYKLETNGFSDMKKCILMK